MSRYMTAEEAAEAEARAAARDANDDRIAAAVTEIRAIVRAARSPSFDRRRRSALGVRPMIELPTIGRPRRPASTPLSAYLLEPLARRLERDRIATVEDLLVVGVDGLVGLRYSERTIAGIVRRLRVCGWTIPGTTPRGGPRLGRLRCPACGWARCVPRCRIGSPCPVCGAAIIGRTSGRTCTPAEAKLVKMAAYLTPAMVRALGDTPRGRARRLRALVALGLLAEARADPVRPPRAHGLARAL